MLDNLRQSKGGIVTWLFLGAIIVVFVISFGPGSYDKGCAPASPTWAARVDGVTLPASEFEREYENLIRFYQQFGQAPTPELAAQLGLAGQALDLVIDRELLAQEAARQGIAVSDAELSRAVQEMPAFQAGGRFDFDTYERYARNVAGSPAKFEALLRKSLLQDGLKDAIRQTVKVSEAEVRQAWSDEQDRATLAFVRIPLAAAEAAAAPSDAEVAAWAAREEAKVKAFYDENPARFEKRARAHVRHLLAKAPTTADAAADGAARAKVEAAAARIAKGEEFAKVAAEVSEDAATKGKGGDLGFVSAELVDPAFAEAAFKLQTGEVSPPVRTATGWHLVQAVEVEAAQTLPLAEARLQIARELLVKEKGRALAMQRAQAALDAAKRGRSLADQFPAGGAVKLGGAALVAADAAFRAADATVPAVGPAPGLREDALAAAAGQVLPRIYEGSGALIVAAVKTRERPDATKFEAQRAGVASRLEQKREAAALETLTAELAKKARIERNPVYLDAVAGAAQQP